MLVLGFLVLLNKVYFVYIENGIFYKYTRMFELNDNKNSRECLWQRNTDWLSNNDIFILTFFIYSY